MTTCRQRSACSKVPWSKGQDTGLSSRRYWVQVPWGSLRLLSLKVRTPASQAGNDGFESRRSYGGYRIMVVRQIVALLMGVRFPLVAFWMGCLEARLLWFTGRFASCPIHFPFACPSGLWCHPAKMVCGDAPKVQILPQTCLN